MRRVEEDFPAATEKDLMLLAKWEQGAELSAAEYSRLAERGYVYVLNENGCIKVMPYCVILQNLKIKNDLLAVGSKIKEKYWDKLSELRNRYTDALLAKTPSHLHKAQLYGLQYTFFSDPWFIIYVLKHLLNIGKLKLPTEEQKKMLTTVIAINE